MPDHDTKNTLAAGGGELYRALIAKRDEAAGFSSEAADNRPLEQPVSEYEAREQGRAAAFNEAAEMVKDAALAAPAAKGGTEVLAGWRLVPEEPTKEMVIGAYLDQPEATNVSFSQAYRAMIEASPPPPAGAASDNRPASKIIAGMQDAVAFAQGDTSRGRIVHPAGAAGGGSGDLAALSAGATRERPYDPVRGWMAEGCCSACSPCSHQKRDPYSICEVCQKAAAIGAERARLSEHQHSVAKAASERAAKNAKVAPELLFAPILWAIREAGPAPTPDPVAQGEPVAWAYEELKTRTFDVWEPALSYDKPETASYRRNIRPLYEAPAAPRSDTPPKPAVTVEEIAARVRTAMYQENTSVQDTPLDALTRAEARKEISEQAAEEILALLSAPRAGGETGDGR